MTVKQISTFYNKDVATIMKYLDYGTSLGECNYLREGNIRKIVCINDDKILNGLQEENDNIKGLVLIVLLETVIMKISILGMMI